MGDVHAEDKHIKKSLLIETITKECTTSSHTTLQQIHSALSKGHTLEATVLSGGYTNYSYKVYVTEHEPELCVFAKLSFEYALWNPDKSAHYDLQRTVNEYEIMVSTSAKTPDSIVSPLALLDIKHDDQNMKCLVTEWSKADEQFCNQFIDGQVDPRIAPKLAKTLAELHLIKDFDPSFNENVMPCMLSLLNDTMAPTAIAASKSDNPKDRTEIYCKELGSELIEKIMNSCIADYHKKDCLVHSDSHVFNILAESKPSIDHLDEFGPHGTVVLCDWEMSYGGPIGRDIGLALSFPIGCLICFGLNGQIEANISIEVYITSLLDEYLKLMSESGKSADEQAKICRNVIGWCGWFMYLPFYILDVQMVSYPIEEGKRDRLKDAVGILGLKFMQLSYDTDYLSDNASVDEIRKLFDKLTEDEITRAQDMFVSFRRKALQRKSSVYRLSSRRLSDTTGMLIHAAESVRNLSLSELKE